MESGKSHTSSEIHCSSCGYLLESFACKIRCHIQINTGVAKAKND